MRSRHTGGRHARVSVARVRAQGAHAESRRRRRRTQVDARQAPQRTKASFVRFAATSLACTVVDQVLAALLFSALRRPLSDMGFLRILCSSVLARCVSLSLNFFLNHRLVFAAGGDEAGGGRKVSRRESLPRFVALASCILLLSTTAVFAANSLLGVEEWQAKLVADSLLFFLNYHGQRLWVFRDEPRLSIPRHKA